MNIDTGTLKSFLAVAETGNLTKAAHRVSRTQSAISQQMAKLEFMLGKPLFIRGKQFCLTPEGELFYGYARQIFSLHREVIDRFKEPELHGEFRFGMPEDFASVYLSDILVEFSRIHPRVLVNIECDLTLNLFERYRKKELDMVLLKMNAPDDVSNSVAVYSEKLEWVAHPNLELRNHQAIPLILAPQPCVYRARALKALDIAQLKWRVVFSSPSYAGTMAAVKAGLGITVLPKTMIPDTLHVIDRPHLPLLADTHICLLKDDQHNPALCSFERFVLEKLKH